MPIIEIVATAGVAVVGTAGLIASRIHSVPTNKFMAKTGPLVRGVHVSRYTVQWPFQRIKTINMEPINYHFLGKNMSKELVPFELPLTFTISPKHPEKDLQGFINYATMMGDLDHEGIKNIIAGIVNGETRGFVGGMTIEQIFSDKEAFRKHVVESVQKDLDRFGLEIHNANIEEMHDTQGNSYFENLKRKALEGANTSSRVAVAEARKEGDIGEKEREVITRKERSTLEANAKEAETTQNQRMSDYDRELTITTTMNAQKKEMAKIEAHQTTETKRIEVESELNKKKQDLELQRLRSEEIIPATAKAESVLKNAEAEANATKIMAEARFYAKQKEADGIKATLEATADGLGRIYDVSQHNPKLAEYYLGLEKGIYNRDGLFAEVAKHQAIAIKDMQPKINAWLTGPQSENGYTNILTDLAKSMPPLLDAIQQQTGLRIPGMTIDANSATNNVNEKST